MKNSEETEGLMSIADATDPFNGVVATFEDADLKEAGEEKRFWVEHQRKDIITDYLTKEEAEAKVEEFVSDTMF